ncbi:2-aminoethanethiol dioxygenase [Strongylocentrotus purpuratus]|uniref:2-aminoethanethiol dioxygenase n=1 Tax=Strongylocentrotus purpuratus TaxID=7668 RepID=A0A7M7LP85_STRPU|nr:2-aminoethanethiol dioxygenase [Strongylocentrotus purpuratus]|eukprot:XP_003725423.1 PREDICTED: 2-aminoethanethiol dioxygenase-like [Strongylocentrotus purpuratus]
MAALQKVTRQAWDIFRLFFKDRNANIDGLKALQETMSKIQASDLNIDASRAMIEQQRLPPNPAAFEAAAGGDPSQRAPVGYMHIFEDGVMTMGVFIIREGSRIPLHNHPGMHGLLKVLYGDISVRTFNTITEDWTKFPISKFEGFPENEPPKKHLLAPTRLGIDQHFTASSEAVLLTPREGNYHSLESVGGPAAFLDILSPPYDPVIGRDCQYFKELKSLQPSSSESDPHWLMCISQPHDFWCDEVHYPGPEISIPS